MGKTSVWCYGFGSPGRSGGCSGGDQCAAVAGDFPFSLIGPFKVHAFANFWSFLMWGLLVWVYVWLVQMLWRVDKRPGCSWR